MKIINAKTFVNKQYKTLDFEGRWKESFGSPETTSSWLIYGESGSGKTEFCVQLSKYLSEFGRVLYVSKEQGDSKGLQTSWLRNGLGKHRVQLGIDMSIEDIIHTCRQKRSHKAIIVDSIDYMNMNKEGFQQLLKLKKCFAFISWAEGKRPLSQLGKAIEYMADVKVRVNNYVAFPRCRYGGNEPYVIWKQRAQQHYAFLNRL